MDIVAVRDPARDRSAALTTRGYESAVADWHDARAGEYAPVLRERGGHGGVPGLGRPVAVRLDHPDRREGAGPHEAQRHRSGLRRAARHQRATAARRPAPHRAARGGPTGARHTGRRLQEAVAAGLDNIVAMLNPRRSGWTSPVCEEWTIWWGANLGAAGERLLTGRVGDVLGRDRGRPRRGRGARRLGDGSVPGEET